jgi:hypothetical protein
MTPEQKATGRFWLVMAFLIAVIFFQQRSAQRFEQLTKMECAYQIRTDQAIADLYPPAQAKAFISGEKALKAARGCAP